jgi:hypothetical protein
MQYKISGKTYECSLEEAKDIALFDNDCKSLHNIKTGVTWRCIDTYCNKWVSCGKEVQS